jgi:hypothetical protein
MYSQANIEGNKITNAGVRSLFSLKWTLLTYLNISMSHIHTGHNNIGALACKLLTLASLEKIKGINLSTDPHIIGHNPEIGNEGALHLSKGGWKHI